MARIAETPISTTGLIEQARAWQPALAALAPATEAARSIPTETLATFRRLKLNHILLLARFGGFQADYTTASDIAQTFRSATRRDG